MLAVVPSLRVNEPVTKRIWKFGLVALGDAGLHCGVPAAVSREKELRYSRALAEN